LDKELPEADGVVQIGEMIRQVLKWGKRFSETGTGVKLL
jgi:hypothetical protein